MRTVPFTAGRGRIAGLFVASLCPARLSGAKFMKKSAHPMNFVNFAPGRFPPGAHPGGARVKPANSKPGETM